MPKESKNDDDKTEFKENEQLQEIQESKEVKSTPIPRRSKRKNNQNKVIIVKNVEEIRTQTSAEEAEERISNALSAWRKTKGESSTNLRNMQRKSATMAEIVVTAEQQILTPQQKRKSAPRSIKSLGVFQVDSFDEEENHREPKVTLKDINEEKEKNSITEPESLDNDLENINDSEQDNTTIRPKKQLARRLSQKFNIKSQLEKRKEPRKQFFVAKRQDSEVRQNQHFVIVISGCNNKFSINSYFVYKVLL